MVQLGLLQRAREYLLEMNVVFKFVDRPALQTAHCSPSLDLILGFLVA